MNYNNGTQVKKQVVQLNRILANEGVMDAFGHASLRNPERFDRFFLPRACAPELVEIDDVIEFGLDGEPVEPLNAALYSERVIHSSLYRRRSDIGAVCHHHSPSILPFCLTQTKLAPVTQLGASMGVHVPIWDSRDRFGATNHLVTTAAEADDLADTLGMNTMVLMRRHGATVIGRDAQDIAFRTIYSCRSAEAQYRAALLGPVDTLSPEESALAEKYPASSLDRAWDLWNRRLAAKDLSPNDEDFWEILPQDWRKATFR